MYADNVVACICTYTHTHVININRIRVLPLCCFAWTLPPRTFPPIEIINLIDGKGNKFNLIIHCCWYYAYTNSLETYL